MGRLKFGIQNGLNVARAGYTEDQIITACSLADRTGYDSAREIPSGHASNEEEPPETRKITSSPFFLFAKNFFNALCCANTGLCRYRMI